MVPLVVANGEVPPEYLRPGLSALTGEEGPLNAVEEIARLVEADPGYTSVGVGGRPGLTGEVELDAMIMRGDSLRAGAVAGIRRFAHPVSIARAVLSHLPHVLLIAEGAERFAREHGFQEASLLTAESRRRYGEILTELRVAEADVGGGRPLTDLVQTVMRRHCDGDTMNAIACDQDGRLAVAVSTSGLAWKHPGRVGDSPVPGAGGYADDRFGAAAATGVGELVLRSGTSLRAVLYRASGMPPLRAVQRALADLRALPGCGAARVRLIFVTPDGEVCGAATWKGATLLVLRAGEAQPTRIACQEVEGPVT